MYDTLVFAGGVRARILDSCIVEHPVVITIDGAPLELTLLDAQKLQRGLSEAVAAVVNAEEAARENGSGHCLVIGQPGNGENLVHPSRLPT